MECKNLTRREDEFDEVDLDQLKKDQGYTKIDVTDQVSQYLKEIRKYPLLGPDEEIKYVKLIEQGDQKARIIFIESNLPLVVSIAKRYIGYGLPFMDLIQEGNFGLMKAVEKFKLSKGRKFSTYAIWWIKVYIIRNVVMKSRTIKIPVRAFENIYRIKWIKNRYYKTFGIEATDEEVAEMLGMSLDRVRKYSAFDKNVFNMLSLDKSVTDDQDQEVNFTYKDMLVDNSTTIAMEEVLANACKSRFWCIVSEVLTPKELEVIKQRVGENGEEPKTLESIGYDFGVTRKRIWQIENEALKKLRQPLIKAKLRSFK